MLYVFFFVPLGSRTLYDHAKRIAGTPEAHDLGRDVSGAGQRVITKARDELRTNFSLPRDGRDGGLSRYFDPTGLSGAPVLPQPRTVSSDAGTRARSGHAVVTQPHRSAP